MTRSSHPAQSLSNLVFQTPNAAVDAEVWNTYWENETKDEVYNRMVVEARILEGIREMETFANEAQRLISFLVKFQHSIAGFEINDFEVNWTRYMSHSERRTHLLEGLVRAQISYPDTEVHRTYCGEITLNNLMKENGALFIKLFRTFVVQDLSTVTAETRASCPHPLWAHEMEKEREKSKDSVRSLIWEMVQLNRDIFISNLISGVITSLLGDPRCPPKIVKVNVSSADHRTRIKEAESNINALENKLGRGIAKEVKKFCKNEMKDAAKYCCEYCYKGEDSRSSLMQCTKCMDKVKRRKFYCSESNRTQICLKEPGYAIAIEQGLKYHTDLEGGAVGGDPVRFFMVFGGRRDCKKGWKSFSSTDPEKSSDWEQHGFILFPSSPNSEESDNAGSEESDAMDTDTGDTEHGFSKTKEELCAKYASTLLSSYDCRSHVMGIYVDENELYLLYYDHSIAITSLNWAREPTTCCTIIRTLSLLKPDGLGLRADSDSRVLCTSRDIIQDILELDVMKVTRQGGDIVKEATTWIYTVQLCPQHLCQSVVAKLNYVPKRRWRTEKKLILDMREKAQSRIESLKFLNNLPKVLYSTILPPSAIEGRIQAMFGDTYELRELHVKFFELVRPVTELANEMIKVFHDIFECQRWLYTEMKMLHSNLNPDNIKFRKAGDTVHGVLFDFELAIFLDDNNPVSSFDQHPVGTMPFVALDLLRDPRPPYRYRYEIESLFYVFYFMVTNHEDGNRTPKLQDPFDSFFSSDKRTVLISKAYFTYHPPTINSSLNFLKLKNVVKEMQILIRKGYGQQCFDECDGSGQERAETTISYENFSAIFRRAINR
ncbi:hypothetical protein BDQ17DRAFT_1547303 [Cyathus striatus]|nr:hypothetical protein BDQ17DRAFT_1547303 [Cyathus striatus]